MKSLKFLTIALLAFAGNTVLAQSKTETFKVSGNCSMCKKHIETAVKADAVTFSNWDAKKQELTVKYDTSKTLADSLQKKVAKAGYDTEKFKADLAAYKALPECCQYERKTALKEEETLEN